LVVPLGTTVAVALALEGLASRKSVTGQCRGPLCGMGICFECRVEINGKLHCRGCQIVCQPGMDVHSDA
jgi:sarcosine oxidase subunit alpha